MASKPPKTGKKSTAQLTASINEVAAQTGPARNVYYRNLQSALAGRGEQIPAAQEAYKSVLAASQQGIRETAKDLRSSGIESRFASPIVDRMGMEGRRSADEARQQVMNSFLVQAPNAVLGTTAQGQAGLQSSANRYQQLAAAAQAQTTQTEQAGGAAVGALGGAVLLALLSRRAVKQDIVYLTEADCARLRADLLAFPLVRYEYRAEPGRAYTGFVIDDIEPSPAAKGDQVDLYGYVTMAVAALQQQDRELAALRSDIAELRARIE